MNKKISCGGFSIDNETIVEENGVLKSVGGGSSNVLVVKGTIGEQIDETHYRVTLDKTYEEIFAAECTIIALYISAKLRLVLQWLAGEFVSSILSEGVHSQYTISFTNEDHTPILSITTTVITPVAANPELAGTEAPLTGLQVGNTKYSVGGGSSSQIIHATAGTFELDHYPLMIQETASEIMAMEAPTISIDMGGGKIFISVGECWGNSSNGGISFYVHYGDDTEDPIDYRVDISCEAGEITRAKLYN